MNDSEVKAYKIRTMALYCLLDCVSYRSLLGMARGVRIRDNPKSMQRMDESDLNGTLRLYHRIGINCRAETIYIKRIVDTKVFAVMEILKYQGYLQQGRALRESIVLFNASTGSGRTRSMRA